MKKYLLLLLFSAFSFGQTGLFNQIKVNGATKKNNANRIVVQDSITKQYHWVLKNNFPTDANVLHKTGDETKSGILFMENTNNTHVNGLYLVNSGTTSLGVLELDNTSTGTGQLISNFSSGLGLVIDNNNVGEGLRILNKDTGRGIYVLNSDDGDGIVVSTETGNSGRLIVGKDNTTDTFILDKLGNVTANSFIKSGGTSSQFLKANGTVDSTVYANDSNVVHKTGNESITGTKTFVNQSDGNGIYSDNQSDGNGIYSQNFSTGNGIYSQNESNGNGIVSNGSNSATGFNYVGQNNGTSTFIVKKDGTTIVGKSTDDGINKLQVQGSMTVSQDFRFNGAVTHFIQNESVNDIAIKIWNGSEDKIPARFKPSGDTEMGGLVVLKSYTVATLPAGTLGAVAYVTDALLPGYLGAIVGGGFVNCPVFFNGSIWVAH